MHAEIWSGEFHGPGIYLGTPMDVYRADPCPAPSLNNTVARAALFKSPLHAMSLHPKLSEPFDEEEERVITTAMDIGSAAHTLAFGIGQKPVCVYAPNWKKKSDQEAKKAIREGGEIPLLEKHYRRAKAMAAISGPVITGLLDGSPVAEAMVVAQDAGGMWRRILIDRARADLRVIIDFKTTGMIAAPTEAADIVYKNFHYFQEAFYRRVLDIVDPEGRGRRRFCFVYQEQEPPFTCTVIETDEAGRTLGDEQVQAACNVWDKALVTGEWPGYPLGPHIASPPPWLLQKWERRALYDETLNPYTEMA